MNTTYYTVHDGHLRAATWFGGTRGVAVRRGLSWTESATSVAAAVAASVAGSLAVYMVAALAVQLRASLHFGPVGLGWAVATYYFGAAASSIALGHLAERIGGLQMMRLACAASGAVLLTIAALVGSLAGLVVILLFGGIASAAMLPSTNQFLSRRVPAQQRGRAFGVKQAAVPLATMLAGLAVPALGLTLGWRWAFAMAGLVAFGAGLALLRARPLARERAAARSPDSGGPQRHLVVLAVGIGLAIAAAGAATSFLVSSAVASGMGRAGAGLLASLAGAVAASVRVGAGVHADRRGPTLLPTVALLLVLGVLGYAALTVAAASDLPVLYLPGTILAFGGGWGWNGLFNLAVVSAHPEHPARASGITQTGARVGGVAGPLLFGLLVTRSSYATAWLATAAVALTGAAVMLLGNRLLSVEVAPRRAWPGGRAASPDAAGVGGVVD